MSRYKWGNLTAAEPSRFIDEIDPQYLRACPNGTKPHARACTALRGPGRGNGFPRDLCWRHRVQPRAPRPRPHPRVALAHAAVSAALHRAGPAQEPEARDQHRGPVGSHQLLGPRRAGADIAEGVTVEHDRFGKGKVLKVEGNAPDIKATIFFPSSRTEAVAAALREVDGSGNFGWAANSFQPGDGQQRILNTYRPKSEIHWLGPYLGEAAFRLLHDLQDPAWVARYRSAP
jgi:hypothetical protein